MMEGSGTLENQLEATKVRSEFSRDCHLFSVNYTETYKINLLLLLIMVTHST